MACVNDHRCGSCPTPCGTKVRNRYQMEWFSSIPVADKEKITGVSYPECTKVFFDMRRQEREDIILKSGLYERKGDDKYCALGHDF